MNSCRVPRNNKTFRVGYEVKPMRGIHYVNVENCHCEVEAKSFIYDAVQQVKIISCDEVNENG